MGFRSRAVESCREDAGVWFLGFVSVCVYSVGVWFFSFSFFFLSKCWHMGGGEFNFRLKICGGKVRQIECANQWHSF